MGPWLLDVGGYYLFPQPQVMNHFLWEYMAAPPGGWAARGHSCMKYDAFRDCLIGVGFWLFLCAFFSFLFLIDSPPLSLFYSNFGL